MAEPIEETSADEMYDHSEVEAEFEEENEEPGAEATSKTEGEEWPAELLTEARAAGLTTEEAKEYDTPKALKTALKHLGKSKPAQAPPPAPKAPEKAPEPTAAAQRKKLRERAKELFDDLDSTSPEYAKFLEEVDDFIAQAGDLAAIKETVSKLLEVENTRQVEAFYDEVDRAFTKIGDERLGKDGRRSYKPDSEQVRRRMAVMREADEQRQELQRLGRAVPGLEDLLERAYKTLYGAPPQKPKEEAKKPVKEEPTVSHKPTHRNGKTPSAAVGRKAALNDLRLGLREAGIPADEDSEAEVNEMYG